MDILFLRIYLTWLAAHVSSITAETILDLLTGSRPYSKSSVDRICSGGVIDRSEGIIISPLYPSQYPSHISCTWHIANNMRDAVTIRFHDLDIEESGSCETPPCCDYNWVKIAPSVNGTEAQYCGQNVNPHPVFTSYSPKISIKFHISRVINGGRGFKLFFSIGKREVPFCRTNDFICSNSECVPKNVQCNGFNDCSDGSDEKYCSGICPSGKTCASVFLCYSNEEHCDGNLNCPDFSDELGCGHCSANETQCGSETQQCYNPFTQRCDRVMDCLNGADEKDCLHGCPGQIMCASGVGCYAPEERCNGITQCSDSSDEKDCGSDLCNYERGGFLCSNGRCIREIWKCDRTNDCGDGSDEHNCIRNSFLTAAVLGSLICGLLLVIAVSCICRLYALRSYENRMLGDQENILPRMSQEFLFREPPPSYAVSVGEHQRSLCVENIHYNPSSRRNRRRIRRARRSRDPNRLPIPSVDAVSNRDGQMMNPSLPPNMQFPFLVPVPNLSERPPSRVIASHQMNRSIFPLPGSFVTGESILCVPSSVVKDTDENSKDEGTGHKNAESSFTEVASGQIEESVQDLSKVVSSDLSEQDSSNQSQINASDNSSFQNTDSPSDQESCVTAEPPNCTEYVCDNDTQKLL